MPTEWQLWRSSGVKRVLGDSGVDVVAEGVADGVADGVVDGEYLAAGESVLVQHGIQC
jgi:hypothetical protein